MNRDIAKLCCRACSYGYDRMVETPALRGSHPLGAIDENLIEVGTSAVLVLEFADRRIVVFPGTQSEWGLLRNPTTTWESIRDWVRNLEVHLTSGAEFSLPGRLHRGFADELRRVLPDLIQDLTLRRNLNGEKPLTITGHSQGGAIAAIAAAVLPLNGFPVSEAYTFAAPHPGDYGFSQFVKASDVSVWRCEYGNDMVPHLPIRKGQNLLDFHAVGTLVYGRQNCATIIVTDSEILTNEMRRKRMLENHHDWIAHHHLDPNYFALLEKLPCDS